MRILKATLSLVVLFLPTYLYAMGDSEEPEELINQSMCREHDHHFDLTSKECIYCAQHLRYNAKTRQCEG